MREIDKQDVPGLGDLRPRQEPAKPAPKEVEYKPGFVRKPDGTIGTNIPGNEAANPPPFPYLGTVETWGRVIERLQGIR